MLKIFYFVVISCYSRFSPIDEQKLKTIITMAANKASMSVTAAGHMYAMRSAAEGLTPAASLSEVLSGLTQVSFTSFVFCVCLFYLIHCLCIRSCITIRIV